MKIKGFSFVKANLHYASITTFHATIMQFIAASKNDRKVLNFHLHAILMQATNFQKKSLGRLNCMIFMQVFAISDKFVIMPVTLIFSVSGIVLRSGQPVDMSTRPDSYCYFFTAIKTTE